jgi:hypothetical protein
MSKLREALEEAKGTVPEYTVVAHVEDVLAQAIHGIFSAAEEMRNLRKTTKAYRGRELKKFEVMAVKLYNELQWLKTEVGTDMIAAKEQHGKDLDWKKLVKLQKGQTKKVMRQTEY